MDHSMDAWSPYAKYYDPVKVGSIDGTDTDLHDNGVARALTVTYKPNKKVIGNPTCTLFIAKLNPQTDEDSIMKSFKKYGPIKRCRLVRDIVTGFSKCYAFLEFDDEDAASSAIHGASRLLLDGQEVLVDWECERVLKAWVPRRFGGGFGGKKESGQLRFGGKDRPFRKPYTMEKRDFGHLNRYPRNRDFSPNIRNSPNYRDSRKRRSRSRERH